MPWILVGCKSRGTRALREQHTPAIVLVPRVCCTVGEVRSRVGSNLEPESLLFFFSRNESLLFGVERKKLFSCYLQLGPTV